VRTPDSARMAAALSLPSDESILLISSVAHGAGPDDPP